jgi:hypothetical protein
MAGKNYPGNAVLPHSKESGDAFIIGDVYDPVPSAAAQDWEINT